MIIDSNTITIGSKLISIGLGLVGLFLLFEIKSMVTERLKLTFIYLIIADLCLIAIRTFGMITELGVWVSDFNDSDMLIFSIFLFCGIFSFYKFTTSVTKQIDINLSSEKSQEEKLEPSIIYATKLKEMENKIKAMEDRIMEGKVREKEADKISEGLRLQLSRLEKAFEEGYISERAYTKGKERIKEVDKILRKKHL
jgi:hypothetical protein